MVFERLMPLMTRDHHDTSQLGLVGNFFDAIAVSTRDDVQGEEIFQTLLSESNVRIERIVSTGQASPEGFWYDQSQVEWVLVLQGAAKIRFEDETKPRDLKAGDFLYIASHRRHRVDMTQANPPTIWLAVHIEDPS